MKNILAISGSIKSNSLNNRLLDFIADSIKEHAHVAIFNELTELPYFEPGLADDRLPVSVQEFLNRIAAADAVLITTPEYVFSIPGILKNALEWTVGGPVLSDKPAGIIVAASLGESAFASLDKLVSTLIQYPIPAGRKLLIQSPGRYFDDSGAITDEKLKGQLIALARNLIA